MSDTPAFPFVAVTGQALLKLALTLTAINPSIGGVLISGPRGSAKTTLARGLAALLPTPGSFTTLPLGASEEMLIGTLNLQQALSDKQVNFNPGLLAKAHHGVLYVDEVNLLPDALVDLLLDVSASKVNIIERDGISHRHPADFLLIGTMNPDEGELRPQLQDRFGLSVELSNQYRIDERIEIVKLREAFDQNPAEFCAQYAEAQQQLIDQIKHATQRLKQIDCPDAIRHAIAERSHRANVDGMRADIVWYRAALAHAAWQGRDVITVADLDAVEPLVLQHRRREANTPAPPTPPPYSRPPERKPSPSAPSKPPETPPSTKPPESDSKQPPSNTDAPSNNGDSGNADDNPPDNNGSETSPNDDSQDNPQAGDWGSLEPQQQQSNVPLAIELPPALQALASKRGNIAAGKQRGQATGGSHHTQAASKRINWFASIASSAHHSDWQWRYQKARGGKAVLHFILLDTSGSTLANQAFAKAKSVVLHIAQQAYLVRERLAILGFGNQQVQFLLPQVRAPKQLSPLLNQTPAGGGTPIREVLLNAQHYLQGLLRQAPDLNIQTYLLTDGRTTQSIDGIHLAGHCTLIDTEQAAVKRGRGREMARSLGADYLPLNIAGVA
ncbi:ATP-binding protein [Leucothrix mucor]|uniref:ATP-binding protein n=1 Tax=Leucothrix mucor TaxID=45248 RepID=UPI00058E64E6|nr:ATP-binding protein [Leucothrix mucor]